MVDSILEFLVSVSIVLSGLLVHLLFSAPGKRTRHNRPAHWGSIRV
jgi:hypothetical protein